MESVKDLVTKGEALLRKLDQETEIGTKDKGGARLREGGQALQTIAEDILASKSADLDEMGRLWARFLRLRGLGYEGEGLLAQTLGVMKAMAKGFPAIFIELAREIIRVDPMKFPEPNLALSLQVQAMVTLGRFYFRLPKPMQNYAQARRWLEEAIQLSVKSPAKPQPVIEPVIPRIYLVEVLRAERADEAQQLQLIEQTQALLNKPLSRFEDHLGDYLRQQLALLA